MANPNNLFPFLSIDQIGKNQWWRYLIGLLAIVIAYIIGYFPLELYMDSADVSQFSKQEIYEFQMNTDFEALGLDKNLGLIAIIGGFAVVIVCLFFIVKHLHRRAFKTLIRTHQSIQWNKIFIGGLIWGLLMLTVLIIDLSIHTESYTFQFDERKFFILLLISIFILPIQTSAEELVFRAYFMQGIYQLTRIPIVAILISTVLFALAHSMNPEVGEFGFIKMMTYYLGFGLLLSVITVLDDGLELALGLHAANNILISLTVTDKNAVIQTDAIFSKDTTTLSWVEIVIYLLCFLIFFAACYRLFWFKKKS